MACARARDGSSRLARPGGLAAVVAVGGRRDDDYDIIINDQVEDVCWHFSHPHLFGSCADDKKVLVWDLRDGKNPSKAQTEIAGKTSHTPRPPTHSPDESAEGEIAPLGGRARGSVVCSGNNTRTTRPPHDLTVTPTDATRTNDGARLSLRAADAHDGDANSLAFNPQDEFLLVSAGSDRVVKVSAHIYYINIWTYIYIICII